MLTDRRGVLIVSAAVIGLVGLVVMGMDLGDDDPPDDTDVVVILGGRADRMPPGIRLARDLDRPLVLSSSAVFYAGRLGLECDEDVLCFRPVPESTAGEAANLRDIAERRGWDHLTVVTSSFHAARARILFRQCFDRERVTVVGVPAPDQSPLRWVLSRIRERPAIVAALTFDRAC